MEEKINQIHAMLSEMTDQTLNTRQASEFLSYSYGYFVNAIAHQIPRVQIHRLMTFKRSDLIEWQKKNTQR